MLKQRAEWCEQIEKQIRKQTAYSSENLACNLIVKGNGLIKDLEVTRISGSAQIDKRVTALIEQAAPFENPPQGTQLQNNIVILFEHKQHAIELSITFSRCSGQPTLAVAADNKIVLLSVTEFGGWQYN